MLKSFICLLLVGPLIAATNSGYHVIKEIPIGGEGGWDYLTVDSAAHRLYVSHATKVVVVDLEKDAVVGEIPNTPGVHGIALAPDLGKGFTSNGKANTVSIFDLKSLEVAGQIQTGQNPDSILYEPLSHRLFTFNGKSKDATVIDARTGTVSGTIPLGGKPEFSVTDGTGKVFVNIEDTGEIAAIDAASMKVTKRFSLKPCDSPSGLSIDPKSVTLFSVCDGKLMAVSNGKTGQLVSTLAIGEGPDGSAFDPSTQTAFSSNGDGTLTVISKEAGQWTSLTPVQTARGARTIALDPKTHKLYLPAAEIDTTGGALPPGARPRYKPGSFKILIVAQ